MISYKSVTISIVKLVPGLSEKGDYLKKRNISSTIIRSAIKGLLKKHNLNYKDFGNSLGLTEGSVKQLMTRGHFTIDRLESIAQRFGLTLIEFLKIAYGQQQGPTRITPSQEELLVEHPQAILLMFLLGSGFSLSDARARLSLEEKKFQKAIHILDRIGIVELRPGGHIFLKNRAPYRFNKDGAIEKKLRPGYLNLVKQYVSAKPAPRTLQRTFEMYISENLFAELKTELGNVVERFSNLARIEAELDDKGKTFPVTGLLLVTELDGWGTYVRSL
jgi:hypothetical protein